MSNQLALLVITFPTLVAALRIGNPQEDLQTEVKKTNTLESPAPKQDDFAAGFQSALLELQSGAPPTGKPPKMWNPSDLDKKADPKADFYQFAVGGWVAANDIPDGYPEWSSFAELSELNTKRIQELVKGLSDKPKKEMTSEEQKIADYYASTLDEDAIEAAGVEPLKPILELVSEESITKDLSTVLGTLEAKYGVGGPYGCGSQTDDVNSSWTLLGCDRSGLSLGNRDYYLEKDKADIKKKYEEHIGKMLSLLGDADASQKAADIVALETELAKVYMDRIKRRDPKNQYHKMTVAQLQDKCKDGVMDWNKYLTTIGLSEKDLAQTINVGDIDAVVAQGEIFKKTPMKTLSAYLRWKVVHSFANLDLPKAFVQENFNFWSTVMYGVKEMKPRWKRALGQTQAYLSMAIGKIYVDKYFSADTKKKALAMVEDIRGQLERRLKEVDWIKAESTRAKALEKVRKFGVKMGYPDKWIDYSTLEIKPKDHFGNVVRARVFGNKRDLSFVNKPTDRTQWGMSPQTINAYYDPSSNEICFPAGILQPPFFSADADDAFNYGGIGAVIGHEMTHGFDDSGRKYDAEGNLVDWWTEDDAKEFEKRAATMVAQTNAFTVFGASPNGILTNGENLADLGGIKLAYGALAHKLSESGEDIHKKWDDGFTTQQHFFLSYAKNWASNSNKEAVLQQIATDPHPPHQWRANGPTSNMEEFHEAFGMSDENQGFWLFGHSAMFRPSDKRVQLW